MLIAIQTQIYIAISMKKYIKKKLQWVVAKTTHCYIHYEMNQLYEALSGRHAR